MIFGSKNDDNKVAELEARIKELETENQRFREALEVYAKPDFWKEGHKFRDADEATIFEDTAETGASVDRGMTAMKALKG